MFRSRGRSYKTRRSTTIRFNNQRVDIIARSVWVWEFYRAWTCSPRQCGACSRWYFLEHRIISSFEYIWFLLLSLHVYYRNLQSSIIVNLLIIEQRKLWWSTWDSGYFGWRLASLLLGKNNICRFNVSKETADLPMYQSVCLRRWQQWFSS